jgi:hypothetical protein
MAPTGLLAFFRVKRKYRGNSGGYNSESGPRYHLNQRVTAANFHVWSGPSGRHVSVSILFPLLKRGDLLFVYLAPRRCGVVTRMIVHA